MIKTYTSKHDKIKTSLLLSCDSIPTVGQFLFVNGDILFEKLEFAILRVKLRYINTLVAKECIGFLCTVAE